MRKYVILCTAGHVDHGKTTLVKRITGVNTDTLKEEAIRGITIELGFAPSFLPNGQPICILDVPGHEKFVKNMVTGATSVDLVLFLIAADEGVMPQTREHMDILRLLGITRGIVVLTKIDKVDEDWLDLVREDVQEYLESSPLKDAQIMEVSTVTDEGIPELIDAIMEICDSTSQRPSTGIARLPLDRVFTMSGFGTVVVGTLWSGTIKPGQTLELLPAKRQVRVRMLQVNAETRDEVYAGERIAVCLTGIEKSEVELGSWLATPGVLRDHRRIDIRLELLPEAPELKQNTRVHVHHGADAVLARVKLLDQAVLQPGESCFAQLELETSLTALPGDRLILRFYSPMFTIGGGTILDAAAIRHKRRSMDDTLSRLTALHGGDLREVLVASMAKGSNMWRISQVASSLQLSDQKAEDLVREMTESGRILAISDEYYLTAEFAEKTLEELALWLKNYFSNKPMRFGAPKKEVAQANFPKLDQKQLRALFHYLEGVEGFEQDETSIWPAGWKPIVTDSQMSVMDSLRQLYAELPFMPPLWSEAVATLDIPANQQGEYLQWFLRSGEMVRLSDDVIYAKKALAETVVVLCESTTDEGFTLAEARDILGIKNRTITLRLMEHLCHTKHAVRAGLKYYRMIPKEQKQ